MPKTPQQWLKASAGPDYYCLAETGATSGGKFTRTISWTFLELLKHIPPPLSHQKRFTLCSALGGSHLDRHFHWFLLQT
ncbi:hypothetical protein AV530_014447 [Patagioenas fasciata monilis]|uniref:Uncharacterized protein n=1 Tax=Patagioenas fasciata monilis TaxID=372326 RepID=A0A1V4KC26_PATFA|nr:hypothetical protein AV530_014447 [Patagioenas fasciata monilis]